MHCPFCNSLASNDSVFCSKCGHMLTTVNDARTSTDISGYYVASANTRPSSSGYAMGIASLILGICSHIIWLPFCWIYWISMVTSTFALCMAAVSIVLGVLGERASAKAGVKNPVAKIGKIVGIVSAALVLLLAIAFICLIIGIVLIGIMCYIAQYGLPY